MIGDMFLRNVRQKLLLKQRTEEAVKKLQVGIQIFLSLFSQLSFDKHFYVGCMFCGDAAACRLAFSLSNMHRGKGVLSMELMHRYVALDDNNKDTGGC